LKFISAPWVLGFRDRFRRKAGFAKKHGDRSVAKRMHDREQAAGHDEDRGVVRHLELMRHETGQPPFEDRSRTGDAERVARCGGDF